jgi:hypothetical protein
MMLIGRGQWSSALPVIRGIMVVSHQDHRTRSATVGGALRRLDDPVRGEVLAVADHRVL